MKDSRYFNLGFIHGYWYDGFMWVRLWNGKGIKGKDMQRHPLLFSERNNLHKSIIIGHWYFGLLKPHKL